MKKSVTIVILAVIAIVFIGSLYYLYQKNQEDPVVYTTETPSKQTIVKKRLLQEVLFRGKRCLSSLIFQELSKRFL